MSAYIVEDEDIMLLVHAASTLFATPLTWPADPAHGEEGVTRDADGTLLRSAGKVSPQTLARILIEENTASVNYRYREHETAPQISVDTPLPAFTGGEVLGFISHYTYQSCEHPDWEASEAYQFCEALRHAIGWKLFTEHGHTANELPPTPFGGEALKMLGAAARAWQYRPGLNWVLPPEMANQPGVENPLPGYCVRRFSSSLVDTLIKEGFGRLAAGLSAAYPSAPDSPVADDRAPGARRNPWEVHPVVIYVAAASSRRALRAFPGAPEHDVDGFLSAVESAALQRISEPYTWGFSSWERARLAELEASLSVSSHA